jgi:hypothetical protein
MSCMPWRPLSKNATVTADIIWRLQLTRSSLRAGASGADGIIQLSLERPTASHRRKHR